eukprot:13557369-Alexandrium_andersonii.AAC.1
MARGARCAEGAGQAAPSRLPLRLRTARSSWPTRATWTGPRTSVTDAARMTAVADSRSSS